MQRKSNPSLSKQQTCNRVPVVELLVFNYAIGIFESEKCRRSDERGGGFVEHFSFFQKSILLNFNLINSQKYKLDIQSISVRMKH